LKELNKTELSLIDTHRHCSRSA